MFLKCLNDLLAGLGAVGLTAAEEVPIFSGVKGCVSISDCFAALAIGDFCGLLRGDFFVSISSGGFDVCSFVILFFWREDFLGDSFAVSAGENSCMFSSSFVSSLS